MRRQFLFRVEHTPLDRADWNRFLSSDFVVFPFLHKVQALRLPLCGSLQIDSNAVNSTLTFAHGALLGSNPMMSCLFQRDPHLLLGVIAFRSDCRGRFVRL